MHGWMDEQEDAKTGIRASRNRVIYGCQVCYLSNFQS